ncbi:MAG: hypothetical protein HRT82_06845 [Henriciella sp.]|nr:hypothetical protein [Henriciella sp.]
MFRSDLNSSQTGAQNDAMISDSRLPVNAIGDVDGFVTAEPTPKAESRRGWRRRRVRRGKS